MDDDVLQVKGHYAPAKQTLPKLILGPQDAWNTFQSVVLLLRLYCSFRTLTRAPLFSFLMNSVNAVPKRSPTTQRSQCVFVHGSDWTAITGSHCSSHCRTLTTAWFKPNLLQKHNWIQLRVLWNQILIDLFVCGTKLIHIRLIRPSTRQLDYWASAIRLDIVPLLATEWRTIFNRHC